MSPLLLILPVALAWPLHVVFSPELVVQPPPLANIRLLLVRPIWRMSRRPDSAQLPTSQLEAHGARRTVGIQPSDVRKTVTLIGRLTAPLPQVLCCPIG
ncbi:hypothetical protein GE09DRAFT_1140957 [Coniochaeta sp. 2T2.1]|nr:hypothetical protein GE09DRAFT_1140957 [Coniochaeta sp. 2T2.1]